MNGEERGARDVTYRGIGAHWFADDDPGRAFFVFERVEIPEGDDRRFLLVGFDDLSTYR